jgi:hypothetical protein
VPVWVFGGGSSLFLLIMAGQRLTFEESREDKASREVKKELLVSRTSLSLWFWKSCLSVLRRVAKGTCPLLIFSVGDRCPELSTCTAIASDPEGNGGPTNTSNSPRFRRILLG